MTMFGDSEPEDAWTPGDPWPVLADNVLRRIALLEGLTVGEVRTELLDTLIAERLTVLDRRPHLSDRERVRITEALADLDYLRGRVNDG